MVVARSWPSLPHTPGPASSSSLLIIYVAPIFAPYRPTLIEFAFVRGERTVPGNFAGAYCVESMNACSTLSQRSRSNVEFNAVCNLLGKDEILSLNITRYLFRLL